MAVVGGAQTQTPPPLPPQPLPVSEERRLERPVAKSPSLIRNADLPFDIQQMHCGHHSSLGPRSKTVSTPITAIIEVRPRPIPHSCAGGCGNPHQCFVCVGSVHDRCVGYGAPDSRPLVLQIGPCAVILVAFVWPCLSFLCVLRAHYPSNFAEVSFQLCVGCPSLSDAASG